jgi:hypothetical protein
MKVRDVTIKFVLVDQEDFSVSDVLETALSDFIWSGALEPSPLDMQLISDVSRLPNRNEKKELRELYEYQFEHEEDEG